MGFIKKLFGGAPKAAPVALQETVKTEEDMKKLRTALYATKGGSSGEEVGLGGTSKRETLFGN